MKTVLKKILQWGFVNTYERIWINAFDFTKTPPILIYQMGKVGSTTVYKSLKNSGILNPVFHVHFLTEEGIDAAEKYYKSIKNETIPLHLHRSKLYSSKLKHSNNLKIITLVRDPIGLEVSSIFQNANFLNANLVDGRGRINTNNAISLIENRLKKNNAKTGYIDTWFDNEMKVFSGIDVFNHSFDTQKGFGTISYQNIDLLILRLEDLDRCFNQINSFLSLEKPVEMVRANIGKKKNYSPDYQYVKNKLKISESVCRKIYSSRYFMHFYNDSMREEFIKKWTKC